MLIKVTNFCSMGCSHCMEDSTVQGTHMPEDIFDRALNFTERFEAIAWGLGIPKLVLLSGGECTEHPDIVKYISKVVERGLVPLLITNGMWLADDELRNAILRSEWPNLFVQVTNDPRFYPKAPPKVDDPRITYIESLTHLVTLGRAARKKGLSDTGLPLKKAPTSFNMRSMARHFRSFTQALTQQRVRAISGMSGHCSPSISDNGDVMAGETRNCFKIGTVDSSEEELTKALIEMRCNNCGLVDNLTMEQKRAIGESVLFSPNE